MIAIIGAGLSGLTAAKVLHEKGLDFRLIEASPSVGGRVKTDIIDGFTLDHGFQVLLTSYPQVQKHLNLKNLKLSDFSPGARIFDGAKLETIADPLREPTEVFKTMFASVGSIHDKIKTLQLKFQNNSNSTSTFQYLQDFGFSTKMIDSFFRPFFSGVFLETELRTRSDYFLFLYKKFGSGLASLPSKGMQAIAQQLCEHYENKLMLSTKVESMEEDSSGVNIGFSNGKETQFSKVIVAVDAPAANKLIPSLKHSEARRSVTTMYFSSTTALETQKYLILNGSGSGNINHIALLSNVNKNYAPKGQHLVSVNILKPGNHQPEKIINELKSWNIFSNANLNHLKTYHIDYAQPDHFHMDEKPNKLTDKIILAGDFMQTPSIEGAMLAGEKAARLMV